MNDAKYLPPVGSVSVTTVPSPTVVEIRDWQVRSVAIGLSPFTATLSPGLYIVSAKYPGQPRFRKAVEIRPGHESSVCLGPDVEHHKSFIGVGQLVGAEMEVPDERIGTVTGEPVQFHPQIFKVRCCSLKQWDQAEPIRMVQYAAMESAFSVVVEPTAGAVAYLQIAIPGQPAMNISIPGNSTNADPTLVQLCNALDRPTVSVRFGEGWAELAAQFIREGNPREARQILNDQMRRVGNASMTAEMPDKILLPAYIPYLMLRLGSVVRNSKFSIDALSEFPVKWLGQLPDAHVIAAEIAARLHGNHDAALGHLLKLRSGQLPLFTDGFSILVSRLRGYAEPNSEYRPSAISEIRAREARDMLRALLNWGAYIDFTALTLSFSGLDITRPNAASASEESLASSDWTTLTVNVSRRAVAPNNPESGHHSILNVLRHLVRHLHGKADGRVQLRNYLHRLAPYFNTDPSKEFVLLAANREQWPRWVVQCLPFPRTLSGGGAVVWSPLGMLLNSAGMPAVGSLCAGELQLFGDIPGGAADIVHQASVMLDEIRSSYPYMSERGCTAAAVGVLKEHIAFQVLLKYELNVGQASITLDTFKEQQHRLLSLPAHA